MPARMSFLRTLSSRHKFEALRILHIDVPLSAKRQFQLFCSEHFPGLADILDCLAADQLWALAEIKCFQQEKKSDALTWISHN
jgi:hypothetical protein